VFAVAVRAHGVLRTNRHGPPRVSELVSVSDHHFSLVNWFFLGSTRPRRSASRAARSSFVASAPKFTSACVARKVPANAAPTETPAARRAARPSAA
jgi:hypothetical protein